MAEVPLWLKKRPTRGWRKEWKTTWAPLGWVSHLPKIRVVVVEVILLGLGQRHPEDQNELEDVVEGWNDKLVGTFGRKWKIQWHIRNQ